MQKLLFFNSTSFVKKSSVYFKNVITSQSVVKRYFTNSNEQNFREKMRSESQDLDEIMGSSSAQVGQYNSLSGGLNNNNIQQNQPKKRNRLTFMRDGMVITFYLRKSFTEPNSNNKNEGYVFIELKEFTDNFAEKTKDPRFIIIRGVALSKLLLLQPKCLVDNTKLEKINIDQKFRSFEIQQSTENKYIVTLKVTPKNENGEMTSQGITSQIELNPEDIILIQKFANRCIDELLNF